MSKVYTMDLAGRPLTLEFGRVAELANGSVIVRYGETTVLVTATASPKPREGIDFFPLSVDYEERLYAVGKIPGGFVKREGKPTEKAILASRVIDRPIRPLFPKDYRNDVTVVATVMSVDQDCSPEVAAMIGSSAALSVSDIPFKGPTGSVTVGLIDGQFIINPTEAQREVTDLTLTVASTYEKVVMIEAGANEVSEEDMFNAIMFAHEQNKKIINFINTVVEEIGKPKHDYLKSDVNPEIYQAMRAYLTPERMEQAVFTDVKQIREANMAAILEDAVEHFKEQFPNMEDKIAEVLYKLEKETVRKMILIDKKRPDGRTLDQLRSLKAEIDIIPRVHGSGMFTRGQTQVLTIATLGTLGEVQSLDGLDNQETKRYIHHYNFPSYSVGETRPSRGPGRREIGHGALAEKALEPMIPSEDEFPYAIRLVSEVLSSNGSTSQASVCGSTLALMAAGVPIKAPVAGISCGLVTGENGEFVLLSDIQGIEDFFGEMDFKVAGTEKGITAIQMDLKNDGLTAEIIHGALEDTKKSRLYILKEVMEKAIAAPREELSAYAPRIYQTTIDPDKIRDVIGPGGKMINKIIDEAGGPKAVKIDIEDDGRIFVAALDKETGEKALKLIEAIGKPPEVGQIYMGTVVRVTNFGAFVEIAPGKEGLVHISKLAHERVNKVEDVVAVGDQILVKVMEFDNQGRINLSRKDAMPKSEAVEPQETN